MVDTSMIQLAKSIWSLRTYPVRFASSRVKKLFSQPVEEYTLHPRNSFVRNPKFENMFMSQVVNDICGVKVLTAPPGSGKTAYVADITNRAVKNGELQGAFYLSRYGNIPSDIHGKWLPTLMDFHSRHHIIDLVNELPRKDRPYLLIFDQFEDLWKRNPDECESFIKELAQEGQKRKCLTILVLVRSLGISDDICSWNGNQKIRNINSGVLKWNKELVTKLFSMLDFTPWTEKYLDENKDRLLELATVAGTPGFLVEASYRKDANMNALEKEAYATKEAWDALG